MARKIVLDYWLKPIPTNQFNWCAVFDDYDGAPDSNCPIGYGATEKEAIKELLLVAEDMDEDPEGSGWE